MTTPQPSIRFCPGCGSPDPGWPSHKHLRCAACGFTLYFNAAAACAAIITCGDELLVAVRGRDPGRGMLDLPGGFIDPGESAEVALLRELREELGPGPAEGWPTPVFFASMPNTYPYAGITYRTCDLFFHVSLRDKPVFVADDDVAEVHWMQLGSLPVERFAFDSMRNILHQFLAR